mmetsp:Transcript_18406/g.42552  ORF Transcript_18406/g.42552 Transcript_18406/m.42552 type:complete len:201 (-) Transcript_18406:715-1317(-)
MASSTTTRRLTRAARWGVSPRCGTTSFRSSLMSSTRLEDRSQTAKCAALSLRGPTTSCAPTCHMSLTCLETRRFFGAATTEAPQTLASSTWSTTRSPSARAWAMGATPSTGHASITSSTLQASCLCRGQQRMTCASCTRCAIVSMWRRATIGCRPSSGHDPRMQSTPFRRHKASRSLTSLQSARGSGTKTMVSCGRGSEG